MKTGIVALGATGAAALGFVAFCACSDSEKATQKPDGSSPASTSSNGNANGNGNGNSADASSNGGTPGPGTTHAGCTIFPNDNAWNRDISSEPIDTELMSTVMPKMNPTRGLHPDWGSSADDYGIPITVGAAAAPAKITWSSSYGPKESDKLPCADGSSEFCYPIPLDAKTEGGNDRHILFLATDGAPSKCVLYELFSVKKTGAGFTAASGAIFKLDSNALRPEGWTSADAAGLPILAGLVRKEEIDRGEITHAIRFTMNDTRNAYIHPATHAAGKDDVALPPMGLRLRLKKSIDESKFDGPSLVIVKAMKKYGLLLADNGSDWYLSGEQNDSWDMDSLNSQLGKVKGSDFEIIKTGIVIPQPD